MILYSNDVDVSRFLFLLLRDRLQRSRLSTCVSSTNTSCWSRKHLIVCRNDLRRSWTRSVLRLCATNVSLLFVNFNTCFLILHRYDVETLTPQCVCMRFCNSHRYKVHFFLLFFMLFINRSTIHTCIVL